MVKIKNMEIAHAVLANSDVKVLSSFFGLVEKAIYLPTNSKLKAFSQDYTIAEGNQLAEVMNGTIADMERFLSRRGVFGSVAIGNVRVEAVLSVDGEFVMFQWFRFVDFQYQPISESKTFVGNDVAVIRQLLMI